MEEIIKQLYKLIEQLDMMLPNEDDFYDELFNCKEDLDILVEDLARYRYIEEDKLC